MDIPSDFVTLYNKLCCHSVQDLFSSSFLSKNSKIKIYRTIILPIVFMGVKVGWSH